MQTRELNNGRCASSAHDEFTTISMERRTDRAHPPATGRLAMFAIMGLMTQEELFGQQF